VTAAAPAALASSDDLAAYLGTSPDSAAQATFMLDSASDVIRSYCGWSITQETVTWNLDADGSPVLLLPTLALDTDSPTVVDTTPTTGPVTLTLGTDYTASAIGTLTRTGSPYRWPSGDRVVTVTATHGYAEIPRSIRAVACSMASRMIATAGLGPASSYRVGHISTTFRTAVLGAGKVGGGEADSIALPAVESGVLDAYRITNGPA
jgi:hypothetical protein